MVTIPRVIRRRGIAHDHPGKVLRMSDDSTKEPTKEPGDTARQPTKEPDDTAKQPTKEPGKRDTSLLSDAEAHPPMPAQERTARPQTGRLTAPWRLLMQIGGQNQTTVGIEVKNQIVLGRSDPVANFYPDLDLTPYGGQEGGISRRHATIVQDDENKALYIEDLNSTNGTRINGFALEPKRRYRLRDGDELELGRIRITLRFVRSPYK
jgi:hypothetical protein